MEVVSPSSAFTTKIDINLATAIGLFVLPSYPYEVKKVKRGSIYKVTAIYSYLVIERILHWEDAGKPIYGRKTGRVVFRSLSFTL